MADQGSVTVKAPRRSIGLKLLLVCALALLMSIPALLVFALLNDRTERAERTVAEVGGLVGGQQVLMGPVLAIPWTVTQGTEETTGAWVVFPTTGKATVSTQSELRRRGLFGVPVYRSHIAFEAAFDLTDIKPVLPAGAVTHPERAEILSGATDPRGAQSDIVLTVAGRDHVLAPAALEDSLTLERNTTSGMPANTVTLFGLPTAGLEGASGVFTVKARAAFSGAQRISVLPFANTSEIRIKGDWKSPSFDGGFVATERNVSDSGFSARWAVPFIARGVPAQGDISLIGKLADKETGVSFVETANPYQSVARSLKYALMFVGLVFLAYFLFETMVGKRVHPAQYVLVGLTQVIFYLLLLSIAERTGFDLAFLIAAGATVGLISAYAGWVFDSRKQGLIALAAFSALYALIYVLMRLEDFALLVGAVTSFAAIAAVMYFTRKLDWYGGDAAPAAPKTSA